MKTYLSSIASPLFVVLGCIQTLWRDQKIQTTHPVPGASPIPPGKATANGRRSMHRSTSSPWSHLVEFHRLALLVVAITMTTLLAGCQGLGSNPPICVAFTPGFAPPTSTGTSVNIDVAATVTDDPAKAGVNWSVTCGSDLCGSFYTANPAASGVPATYHAPDSIPSGNTVTLTATSVTDNTKSSSSTVTITLGPD